MSDLHHLAYSLFTETFWRFLGASQLDLGSIKAILGWFYWLLISEVVMGLILSLLGFFKFIWFTIGTVIL